MYPRIIAVLTTGFLCLTATRALGMESPPLCGTNQMDAMARACSDILQAEAHFLAQANPTARADRQARILSRLEEAWDTGATRDPRCREWVAPPEAALQRLTSEARAAVSNITSASCARKFLRQLRRYCRQAVRVNTARFPDPIELANRRAAVIQRIRSQIGRRWPVRGCAAEPTAGEAIDIALALTAVAAGESSSRGIASLAQELGLEFGVAIEPHEVENDPTYQSELLRQSTSLTAENAMKWREVHPTPDQWNFGPSDAIVELAEAHGKRLRGHTLIWGATQLPPYVQSASSGAELREFMAEHIRGLVGRYAGRIEQWDVVNEPLPNILNGPTPDGLAPNVFRRLIGADYIALAFELAHEADPSAQLFLNENGIHSPGARQDRIFSLVQDLLSQGVPIHGVGFQAHVGLIPVADYPDAETLAQSIRRFTALGVTVELTELDISVVFRGGDLASRLEMQAADYRNVVRGCLSVPGCTGITLWGLSDRYTWLRTYFGFDDHPLPFDDDWKRKPAYFGIRAALWRSWLDGD